MAEVETALTKYLYLDIVSFTKGRSVEAQADLVGELNKVVRAALDIKGIESDSIIFIPTGDGMCIALLEVRPYDIHLQTALEILSQISEYNDRTDDEMRKFQVRIGINENVDNVVVDINGRRNVAGTGINMAQRTMSLADGGQVFMGQTVYEVLSGREKYMKSLRRYDGEDKHGNKFPVYQFIAENCKGLNIDVPSIFKPPEIREEKLSKVTAYYMAHAIKNKNYLFSRIEDTRFDSVSTTLLYLKALDSVDESRVSQYERPILMTYGAPSASFEEQYKYYQRQDFWLLVVVRDFTLDAVLGPFLDYFENARVPVFVTQKSSQKLKDEWPTIWEEFSLATELDEKGAP